VRLVESHQGNAWESRDKVYKCLSWTVQLRAKRWLHNASRVLRVRTAETQEEFASGRHDTVGVLRLDATPNDVCTGAGHRGSVAESFDIEAESVEYSPSIPASTPESIDWNELFRLAGLSLLEQLALLERAVRPGRQAPYDVSQGRYAAHIEHADFMVFPPIQSLRENPENPEEALSDATTERPMVGVRTGNGRDTRTLRDAAATFSELGRTKRGELADTAARKLARVIKQGEEEEY